MKNLLLLLTCLSAGLIAAQSLNTTLRDQLDYSPDLNDVWGYVAPDGTEYALVGLRNGLSIVSLADPDNIQEVHFISGDNSTWRDIKTYRNHAYVVADSGNDGLLIVDLSGLPATVEHEYLLLSPTGGAAIAQAHNISIDTTTGILYFAGADLNGGGMILYDLTTDPEDPDFVGLAPNVYAHDVHVDNGRMYASEISVGELSIYDVSNPTNIQYLGGQQTPFDFTHNAWNSDDDNFVFTTDERGNASTAAYDITNPSDPTLVDEFRPQRSIGQGSIPHNAHVLDDYLVISHYTDGLEIVDASVPDNMVEVGYYDTWPGADGGFNGTWGAYPFLPSGLVLATDIDNGLFVIEVDYKRAARLKGRITADNFAGDALNNVNVAISNPLMTSDRTDAAGQYRAGMVEEGMFNVTFSLPGYIDLVVPLEFENGVEITLDTFLLTDNGNISNVAASVTSVVDNGGIANAEVLLVGEEASYAVVADGAGDLIISQVVNGEYQVFLAKWGFIDKVTTATITGGSVNLDFQLSPGYQDGFMRDQGWTTSAAGTVSSGFWVREAPNGTTFNGDESNPANDSSADPDIGSLAYVTGNTLGASGGGDDIDGGEVVLISPLVDLSLFTGPSIEISYDYWFFNAGGNGAPNDQLTIAVDDGNTVSIIATHDVSASVWRSNTVLLPNTSRNAVGNFRLIVTAEDVGAGHIAEAGFDNFRVSNSLVLPVELSEFTANSEDQRTVQLKWVTTSESENDYFVIERSSDARTFRPIGTVDGAGNSTQRQEYIFEDDHPFSGQNHYRLRQVDFSGATELSELRTVNINRSTSTQWFVYPSPTKQYIRFSNQLEGMVTIYRIDGQLVLSDAKLTNGRIDVSSLQKGMYFVRVGEEAGSFIKE